MSTSIGFNPSNTNLALGLLISIKLKLCTTICKIKAMGPILAYYSSEQSY